MEFTPKEIENYCLSVSTQPSSLCQELYDYTMKNVPKPYMLIGPMVGSVLQFLVRITNAKRILEVGCFTGYSALAMAEALPKDGKLTTLDINPETVAVGQKFWARSEHGSKIEFIPGPADETMRALSGPYDFVFIDANKTGYLEYLKRALEITGPNGLFALDNSLYSGRVLNPNETDPDANAIKQTNAWIHSQPSLTSSLLPVRDGIHLVRKRA